MPLIPGSSENTRNSKYLVNDIRPVISWIPVLLPQIISMVIRVQDLHSLHKVLKRIIKNNTREALRSSIIRATD